MTAWFSSKPLLLRTLFMFVKFLSAFSGFSDVPFSWSSNGRFSDASVSAFVSSPWSVRKLSSFCSVFSNWSSLCSKLSHFSPSWWSPVLMLASDIRIAKSLTVSHKTLEAKWISTNQYHIVTYLSFFMICLWFCSIIMYHWYEKKKSDNLNRRRRWKNSDFWFVCLHLIFTLPSYNAVFPIPS